MHTMKIRTLLIMAFLHFIAMYFLMYAMVDRAGYMYLNLNNLYMASLMTSPMLIIEIVLMGSMYKEKKIMQFLLAVSIVLFAVSFLFIRQQTAIGNKEFIRSMIPHHSGAILMCREADIKDRELQQLCTSIIKSQQSEIDQMEGILGRLN